MIVRQRFANLPSPTSSYKEKCADTVCAFLALKYIMCYNAQRLCRNDACSKLCIMKRTEAYENGDHRTIQIRKGQQDTV